MSESSIAEHPAKKSKTPAAKYLYEDKEEVLVEWVKRVKTEVQTAMSLKNPVVINTIPLFLDGLAESLCEESSRETATESSNMAQEHGSERARITHYGPEQIIQEYRILREVIRARLKTRVGLSEREELIIQKSFDKAIQDSMITYFMVHAHIREQFVATLTHDLRNPIGAIKMAAQLISEVAAETTSPDSEEILDLANRIAKNVKRADRMIQDMLDASIIQIGQRPTGDIVLGDMQAIAEAAISDLSPEERARVQLNLFSVPGYWDVEALQRSVENLIGNAFKYGAEHKPIRLAIESTHKRVMISVHNEGNPIPAENLEYLFQVFRRAESAKTSGKKGWGVGLALARSTAERMGGSLGVESSLESGTTFTIDIPCDSRPFVDAPTNV